MSKRHTLPSGIDLDAEHATVGDLDRRGQGDVWTLTVAEYLAASRWKRLRYRTFRNPFLLFAIGPAFLFMLSYRWPSRGASRRERFGVHFTNAWIVAVLVTAYLTIGVRVLLIAQLPPLLLAATAGVWLFYVQHQYEDVYWARRPDWDPMKAALEGSSYYKLPRVLQWFSGNIGFHHIHHLSPQIPNYNLQRCHEADAIFQQVKPITVFASLKSLRLRLWDEAARKLVGYRRMSSASGQTRRINQSCSSRTCLPAGKTSASRTCRSATTSYRSRGPGPKQASPTTSTPETAAGASF